MRLATKDGRAFLSLAPTDSPGEWMVLLQTLALGFDSMRPAPLAVGFRQHCVIDPRTRECVGDCRVPAVGGHLGRMRVLLIPQVHVLVGATPLALDFLAVVSHQRARRCIDLEVDGSGHRSDFDKQRQKMLGMPTVRVNEKEVGERGFPELLAVRLAAWFQ